MGISLAVIVAYLGLFTIIGFGLNRKNKDSDDWATGSSNMNMWMLPSLRQCRSALLVEFYGMLAGYGRGLLHWGLNTLFEDSNNSMAGGFPQFWYELCQSMGERRGPTFSAS